jgi:hypothetical protein
VGAQQLGHRQAGAPGLEVPQRDVEGGDRLRRQAAAADAGAGPDELVPQSRDVVRVFAEQVRCDLLGMHELPRPAGALAVREADAAVAFPGLHFGEQEGDLGQRLLPAGQHLGVADRRGQRQEHQRQPDPLDAVGAGLAGRKAGRRRVGGDAHGVAFTPA